MCNNLKLCFEYLQRSLLRLMHLLYTRFWCYIISLIICILKESNRISVCVSVLKDLANRYGSPLQCSFPQVLARFIAIQGDGPITLSRQSQKKNIFNFRWAALLYAYYTSLSYKGAEPFLFLLTKSCFIIYSLPMDFHTLIKILIMLDY